MKEPFAVGDSPPVLSAIVSPPDVLLPSLCVSVCLPLVCMGLQNDFEANNIL